TELAKSILEIIFGKKLDTKNIIIDAILVTEFRQLLRFQKDIILLYDGLDEYRLSYSEQGLKQIFSCTTSFVCNSIFTLRKEFYDERNTTFNIALEVNQRPTYSYIELREWNDKEILEYISELKSKVKNEKNSYGYLVDFEKLIKQKKYNDVYGDIPKRPLFLKMLCDDIMSGETKIKNISQLYESYLTKKFILDREGSSLPKKINYPSSKKLNRPLSKEGDICSITDYIFELLAKISWEMITIDGIHVLYNESVDEKIVTKLMKLEYDELNSIIELLLNSVLIPFDKRKRREFKAKFAHKSFQEYFLAYYLIFVLFEEEEINITALMLKYSQGTTKFCRYMVEEIDGLQDKIDQIFINLNIEIDNDALLYKLVTLDGHLQKDEQIKQDVKVRKESKEYDFFISHSSRDKIPFVEDLVAELQILGLRIFYDKNSINSSENIVWKINKGFISLKYGTIIIISPNFIRSNWCNEELAISFSLKIDKSKKLIPILLNISDSEMKDRYAILRSIKAIDSTSTHIKSIAQEIFSIREQKEM
ncbi:MAG TPA: toll/interleukin-1 receptor domain-containing protein, partial [Bacteroidetes bacterium]|nr:toll/interleukin-1 receptor domain-containing protein [Bacteroidota bacterium]